jgi:hypothetical protein
MNTVRAAAVRAMPPATEIAMHGVLYQDNEVAA